MLKEKYTQNIYLNINNLVSFKFPPKKASFLQLWAENQTVSSGNEVFSIIPTNDSGFITKAKAQGQNSGKIKVGFIA